MVNGHESPRLLMEAKLAESGLTMKDAKRLRMSCLTHSQVTKLDPAFKPYPALLIPYFCLKGKPTKFYRLRYLGDLLGFDKLRKKQVRYVQPTDSTSEAYLPPLFDDNWSVIAKDAGAGIFITEGELKAACAGRFGFPTIGLGGVWSWKSAKKGISFLPIFDEFEWKSRRVYLVFDSDFATNPDVMRALVALAKELTARGAMPSMVKLPELPELLEKGKKTGLDDFLVAQGGPKFYDLVQEAEPYDASKELWKLNSEVVYIKSPGLIIVNADGRKISAAAFKEHAYANRHFNETKQDAKGENKTIKKPLAPEWLTWEQRAELSHLTYKPGAAAVTDDGAYNYWPGWGAAPKKGDVSLWTRLLDYIFGNDKVARTWFERWCAWPIQHPGEKLYAASVFWGRVHGTGKSLVGYSIGKCYGRNFSEISDENLDGSFNEWAENKQFVMGDDVTGQDQAKGHKKQAMELLKFMITRQKLRINAKYLPTFEIPDCINYYFTSNFPDSFLLEDTDRRFFIWQMPEEMMPRAFYEAYDKWMHHGDLASSLLYHLMNLPLGDFNPRAEALVTSAKKSMIVDSKNEVAAWCSMLYDNPDEYLKVGSSKINSDLYTTSQLMTLYDPTNVKRTSPVWLGRELKKAGFKQVNEGATLLTTKGPQRLYAIRDIRKWVREKPATCAAHWNKAFGGGAK